MSKNFEKKVETKELEKKLEVKEIKPEKFERKEFKEKPEKQEIKEFKEKPEKREIKEFKEPFKERVEVKEIKELEKQVIEKGGKELVETFEPGGEVIQPQAGFTTFGDASGIAKPKETDKVQKEIEKIKPEKENPEKAVQKEIEKIKPEKENPEKAVQKEIEKVKSEKEFESAVAKPKESDKAPVKDIEKIKPEKENFEKAVQKEIEKIKPEKELKLEKHELKDHKIEKIEHKELKTEKHELKDLKVEIFEKAIQKDFLPEKRVFENDPKGIVENPGQPGFEVDPALKFSTKGTAEERMQQLEEAVTKLSHFIGVDLRPDLSTGALKNETDVDAGKQGEDDKGKKK